MGHLCPCRRCERGGTYLNCCKPHKKEATALTKDMIGQPACSNEQDDGTVDSTINGTWRLIFSQP